MISMKPEFLFEGKRRTLVLLVESMVAAAPAEGVALGVALTIQQ